jgi:hypothetical protein
MSDWRDKIDRLLDQEAEAAKLAREKERPKPEFLPGVRGPRCHVGWWLWHCEAVGKVRLHYGHWDNDTWVDDVGRYQAGVWEGIAKCTRCGQWTCDNHLYKGLCIDHAK